MTAGIVKQAAWVILVAGLGCSFESASAGTSDGVLGATTSEGGTDGSVDESSGGTTTLSSGSTGSQPTSGTTTSGAGPVTTEGSDSVALTGLDETTTTTTETNGDSSQSSSSSGEDEFVLCDGANADLRGCYDFANAGGGTFEDHSMYGNDGASVGVSVDAGPFGDSVRVDDNAEVSVPDSPSLDVVGPAAWELWVYFDTFPASGRVGLIDNEGQYSMTYNAGQGLRCNGAGLNIFAPNVPLGQWVHVICNRTDDELSVWVDGVLAASDKGGESLPTSNTLPVSFADTSPAFNEPLDGLLGGARIWSVARTPAQIAEAAEAAAL